MNKLLGKFFKGFLVLIALAFLLEGVAQAHLFGVADEYTCDDFLCQQAYYGGYQEANPIGDGSYTCCMISTLYVIDPETGSWTRIGNIREQDGDDVYGYNWVTGLDFEPDTGELFAVGYRCTNMAWPTTPRLLTIDPCTGWVESQVEIDTSDLADAEQIFTDISFQTDGTLYAYYLAYTQAAAETWEGCLATIDTDTGEAEALGDSNCTGQRDFYGNGIGTLPEDPNDIYHAESKNGTSFVSNLNQLDHINGDVDDSDTLTFHTPIVNSDFPQINSMDGRLWTEFLPDGPVEHGLLYASVRLGAYTAVAWGYEYNIHDGWCNITNYLAIVDEGGRDVIVIGQTVSGLKAIAFAPLPIANAGSDITVEATSSEGAVVCLDGSGTGGFYCCNMNFPLFMWYWWEDPMDFDNPPNMLHGMTPCGNFPLGTHEVHLMIDDCNGQAMDSVLVTVRRADPNAQLTITCPNNVMAEQDSYAGASVTLTLPDVSDPNVTPTGIVDPNHPLTFPYVFPLGLSTVTWTATNASGSVSCTQNVFVVDTTPPTINSVTATPDCLFPMHCLNEVIILVDANDICDPAPTSKIIGVSSNQGSYHHCLEPDWFITDPLTVLLRAKKDLVSLDNRIYTITVECTDASGNSSTATVTVEVGYNCHNFRDFFSDFNFFPDFNIPDRWDWWPPWSFSRRSEGEATGFSRRRFIDREERFFSRRRNQD